MSFPLSKYQFYVHNNRVIAVSTYAGKTVRGIAICDNNDKSILNLVRKSQLLVVMRKLLRSVLTAL